MEGCNFELKRGSAGGMHSEVTGKRREAEVHTRGESSWIPWRVAAAELHRMSGLAMRDVIVRLWPTEPVPSSYFGLV